MQLKNQTKFGKAILNFVGQMRVRELQNLDNKTLGLDDDDDDDDDETLEDDESKGNCSEDDGENDDEDSGEDDEENGDEEDDVKICDKSKKFIILRRIGRISELTLRKIM